jgi:hypothetical protein
MNPDIELYKELISFCNDNQETIESKFKRELSFSEFNETCYVEMFEKCRKVENPPPVKYFKEIIPGLSEAYKENGNYFMKKRNESIKGLDIQKGQWYEKALQLFLNSKGLSVNKRGFPYPDFEVKYKDDIVGYYELKYIKAPFLSANQKIKNTYPYSTTRFDYEASLTLDTGNKLANQRKQVVDLMNNGYSVHYVWWYDSFHIKGIFAMSADEVYNYYDNIKEDLLIRNVRQGDEETHQERGKIYPPLLNMMTFSEYINFLMK